MKNYENLSVLVKATAKRSVAPFFMWTWCRCPWRWEVLCKYRTLTPCVIWWCFRLQSWCTVCYPGQHFYQKPFSFPSLFCYCNKWSGNVQSANFVCTPVHYCCCYYIPNLLLWWLQFITTTNIWNITKLDSIIAA